jgi:anti-sigma B factor antagonist
MTAGSDRATSSGDFSVAVEPLAGGGYVVSVSGELDLATAPKLTGACNGPVLAADALLVDLTECTFIDSTGIASLLHLADERGGTSRRPSAIVTPGSQPARVFELTGVDKTLTVSSDRAQALSSIQET